MGRYGRATLFDVRRRRRQSRHEWMGSWPLPPVQRSTPMVVVGHGIDGGGSGRRRLAGRSGDDRKRWIDDYGDIIVVLVSWCTLYTKLCKGDAKNQKLANAAARVSGAPVPLHSPF